MIVARAPLRISLGGGGSDLPSYYQTDGPGFLVAAALDKYVYVAVHENFEPSYLLKYSEIENVTEISDIRHPLVREALRYFDVSPGIEITSFADIPAGTGLGSSGSFAVALICAISAWKGTPLSREEAARLACHLEIEVLGEPVGKQDQYIASFGGITAFEFRSDESVAVHPLSLSASDYRDLESSFMLFFTGVRRSASEELRQLISTAAKPNHSVTDNLKKVVEKGRESQRALESGELSAFGSMLTEQWELKLARQPSTIHSEIDSILRDGIAAGAHGGKLVGAGGGGFLLFCTQDRKRLRSSMQLRGLQEVPFGFDTEGVDVLSRW